MIAYETIFLPFWLKEDFILQPFLHLGVRVERYLLRAWDHMTYLVVLPQNLSHEIFHVFFMRLEVQD